MAIQNINQNNNQPNVQTEANDQKIKSDSQTFDFIDILVQAIIGYPISNILPEKRLEIVGDCVKLFSN